MVSFTQLRKLILFASVLSLSFVVYVNAYATVLNFAAQPEAYSVSPIIEEGYTFNSTADGLGTNNAGLWPSNGTMHLMSWTNGGGSSGFTLTANDNSVFSVTSFAFGSGYVNQSEPASSLVVSGTGGNGAFSQTFTSGVDYLKFGPGLSILSMLGGHTRQFILSQHMEIIIGPNSIT